MSDESRARRRGALRAVGSSLLVVLLLTAGIARLARVKRPTIRDATPIRDTPFELARVALARPGRSNTIDESTGTTLGWTVRCREGTKREIVALPGLARPAVARRSDGVVSITRGDFRREISDASCP